VTSMTTHTITLSSDDDLLVYPATNTQLSVLQVVGDDPHLYITAMPVAPTPGANLIRNMYFADYTLGTCQQCGVFPFWEQRDGTWRYSRVKSAEQHTLPPDTVTAVEWDRDRNADGTYNGWVLGQDDELWQVVFPPAGWSLATFAFHAIHHVYGGDCIIGVDALDETGSWHRISQWWLSNSGMPMATRTERIWRRVEVSASAPTFVPIALRLHLWARMLDLRDGMKLTGMELSVS